MGVTRSVGRTRLSAPRVELLLASRRDGSDMYGSGTDKMFGAMLLLAAVIGWAAISAVIWLIKWLCAHLSWVS